GVGGVRRRGRAGAIGPAALALVLDLAGAVAYRARPAPAFVRPLDAVRIEEEDGVAERALTRAPTLARRRVELLVWRGKERPVDRVQNQRLAGAVLADDGEQVAEHVEGGVFVAVPVDEPNATDPRPTRPAAVLAVLRAPVHSPSPSAGLRSSCITRPAGGRKQTISPGHS